jgi:predicted metalloprotease with PDZ domain
LRSYGTGYRPFNWQVAPLIETIWLNEGFVWYVTYVKVLQQAAILKRFRKIVNTAPDFIKNKPLKELSLLGSTQYSNDFRIGRNLFARGGLLAADLDDLIQKQTQGKKSLKDALNGLLHWTEKHNRAFTYEEIPEIIKTATSVDISEVWKAHQ